jgi:hypothetical protein
LAQDVIALPRLGGLHHRYEWRAGALAEGHVAIRVFEPASAGATT